MAWSPSFQGSLSSITFAKHATTAAKHVNEPTGMSGACELNNNGMS